MGNPIFDTTFQTGRFETKKGNDMTNLEALKKVYQMAYHAKDLKGEPWTNEEKEALQKIQKLITDEEKRGALL